MSSARCVEDVWNSVPIKPAERTFDPAQLRPLPEGARRYLEHSIVSGSHLASAVRLKMHGEIRLKSWHPFSAEQVIDWRRGMMWQASVRVHGMPIRGGDSFLDGEGVMQWKLLGVLPVAYGAGRDITRSAAGRMNIESIWLPSVLCEDEISWSAADSSHAHASFSAHNETAEIEYTVDKNGALKSVSMPRWGNPDGKHFQYVNCGGFVEEEGTFSGYTVPTRMRVGWYFGTGRFESDGEFFRVAIDDAVYR